MNSITIRLDEDAIESLDDEAEEHGVSRSEYIRDIINRRDEHERIRDEYEERLSEHEDEIDELETKVGRLEREKRMILEEREERNELVEYVDEERSWREQPLSVRLKWWFWGKE